MRTFTFVLLFLAVVAIQCDETQVENDPSLLKVETFDEDASDFVENKEDTPTVESSPAANFEYEDALTVENEEDTPVVVDNDEAEDSDEQSNEDEENTYEEDEPEDDSEDEIVNDEDMKLDAEVLENNDIQKRSYRSTLRKGRVIKTLPVLNRGYRLSFQIQPIRNAHYGWSSILHATIGGNMAKNGDRTPGIFFRPGSFKLHICSTVGTNKNYCYDSAPLHRYKVYSIVIQQVQKAPSGNLFYYQIIINNKVVVDVLNVHPVSFKNVKYYASDPWYAPANAVFSNFKVENSPFKAFTLLKPKKIKVLSTLSRHWKLQFSIKPLHVKHGWTSIIHASIGENVAKYGDRIPAVFFHSGSTRLHICSAVSGNKNYCKDFKPLPLNKFSTIIIQQIPKQRRYGTKSYGTQYHYQIIINKKQVLDVVNTKPQVFHNVNYYASDPWHPPAIAIVSHIKLYVAKAKKH